MGLLCVAVCCVVVFSFATFSVCLLSGARFVPHHKEKSGSSNLGVIHDLKRIVNHRHDFVMIKVMIRLLLLLQFFLC